MTNSELTLKNSFGKTMHKKISHVAFAVAVTLLSINPDAVFGQEAQNTASSNTKGGLQFKKSNPIPFGRLDLKLGGTFTYQPNPANAGRFDLGIPVDKPAKVKLLDYTVNDDVVEIAVDVEGFGRGRLCIETIFFASSVDKALSFMSSPQTYNYADCNGNIAPADTTIAVPVKSSLSERDRTAITGKLDKLKATEKSLNADLERVRTSIAELNEKLLSAAGNPKSNWIIKEFGISDVNSAGGVEPYFIFFNPNEKSPIKYISLQISLFNAVGDMVGSQIGNERTRGIKFTGPLTMEDGESKASWNPIWYNPTGSCIKVESMSVTWMNGKSQSYIGKALQEAMAPDVSNSCRVK